MFPCHAILQLGRGRVHSILKTFCFPMHKVHTCMSRRRCKNRIRWLLACLKQNISLWAAELSKVMPKVPILNSWLYVQRLTSICEWNTSSGHLGPSATSPVICLPGMSPGSGVFSSLQCEPAAELSREFQAAFPTGNECSCLWQTRMIRVARQHVPNHHAAKTLRYNARSLSECTPWTDTLCLLSLESPTPPSCQSGIQWFNSVLTLTLYCFVEDRQKNTNNTRFFHILRKGEWNQGIPSVPVVSLMTRPLTEPLR